LSGAFMSGQVIFSFPWCSAPLRWAWTARSRCSNAICCDSCIPVISACGAPSIAPGQTKAWGVGARAEVVTGSAASTWSIQVSSACRHRWGVETGVGRTTWRSPRTDPPSSSDRIWSNWLAVLLLRQTRREVRPPARRAPQCRLLPCGTQPGLCLGSHPIRLWSPICTAPGWRKR